MKVACSGIFITLFLRDNTGFAIVASCLNSRYADLCVATINKCSAFAGTCWGGGCFVPLRVSF